MSETVRLAHHDSYPDRRIRTILANVRTIAMVGASTLWRRPSFYAMKYLQKRGYRVIPVNPSRAGAEILGETVHPDIASVPGDIDMVDIFRPSGEALEIARDAIANKEKGIQVLWMQLAVRNDEAARLAEEAGLVVVMDRCPKIEYARLSGELGWSGINTGIVTAKSLRPPRA